MAKGSKIEYSDIIDPGLIERLKKELSELRQAMSGATAGDGGGKAVKETNKALKETVEITEDLLRLQKIDIRLEKEAQVLKDKKKKYGQLSEKDAARLTKLTEARKQNNRELNNEARLTQQVNGSMNQLSQALAKNKIEYRKLTKAERENEKIGVKLLKTIGKQDAQIKKLDKTLGDNQRNVGNYGNAIAGAGSQFGILGTAMMQVTKVFNLVKVGFRSLNAAIASTGIGLLLVAIASLVGWFKKSVAGGEAFTRIMAPLKAVLQVVTNIVVSLGGAIAKLFTGDFQGAIDQATGAFKDLSGQIERANDAFKQLAELTILNKKQVGDWAIKQAQLNKELQEARLFARDETQSLEDRIAAIKRTMAIEDELAEGRKDLIKQRIAMIVINEQAGKSNQDEINERKQLVAELIQVEADQAQRKVRLITYGTTLNNQAAAQKKAILDAEIKAQDDFQKQLDQDFEKEFNRKEEKLKWEEDALQTFKNNEKEKQEALEKTAEIEKIVQYTKMDLAAQAFGVSSEFANKGSQEFKILKTAETAIATYSSAQKSYDALAGIPYVGPALGAVAAAIAVAAGLANIAKINDITLAEGTESVEGGTPGKDSVNALLMPKERVVPVDINRKLMGIPNEQLPGLINMALNQNKSNAELQILSQIAHQGNTTNKYLKGGLKWMDAQGAIHDVDGNITRYLN